MANEARRTLTQLVAGVRNNLDEATAAFWADATNLYPYITRSAHAVATEVRKLKADYYLTPILSTDSSTTMLGETYLPSSLGIAASTTEYTLPPDCLEVKLIECITSGYEQVPFIHRDLASPDFRRVRMEATSNQSPTGFYFDVTGERTLVIGPPSDTALNIRLWYVSSTIIRAAAGTSLLDFATGTDTLIMPFPGYMAVEEVATARAMLRDRDMTSAAYAAMADQSVRRLFGANARQTQDAVVVGGLFE